MRIFAEWILPVTTKPIEQGFLEIEGNRITQVKAQKKTNWQIRKNDLVIENGVILPGFVNAHAHLELSFLENQPITKLNKPSFTQWVEKLVALKSEKSPKQIDQSVAQGLQKMLRCGVTTIGDHLSYNTPLRSFLKSPQRGIMFIEILGAHLDAAELVYQEVVQNKVPKTKATLLKNKSHWQIEPSLHAFYSVHPEVITRFFDSKRAKASIHFGESQEEMDYFKSQGSLYQLVKKRIQDVAIHWQSPKAVLKKQKHLPQKLNLVHANYLDTTDYDWLKKNEFSITHCPHSHQFFGHQDFDFKMVQKHKINLALGTDSAASHGDFDNNFLADLNLLYRSQKLTKENIIYAATLAGAFALGFEKEVGSLEKNKKADLIIFEAEEKINSPYFFLKTIKKPSLVMIDGTIQQQKVSL